MFENWVKTDCVLDTLTRGRVGVIGILGLLEVVLRNSWLNGRGGIVGSSENLNFCVTRLLIQVFFLLLLDLFVLGILWGVFS